MFPNPQDALPLPRHPDLDQYKKQAKDLVKACRSGDPDAIGEWAATWIDALAAMQSAPSALDVSTGDAASAIASARGADVNRWINEVEEFARRTFSRRAARGDRAGREGADDGGGMACKLADALFVIARSHGFESWPKLATHLEGLVRENADVARFESAADAIVTGDVRTLVRLLREDPLLIRARSTREHHATLLHYVSANGIEGYRQKTPANIVAIADRLLNAGAEVDATADVYGGDCATLLLTATSAHPRLAGVQNALLDRLLAHGAAINRERRGRGIVIECLHNFCLSAAQFLASRGARLDLETAAGVGHVDLVMAAFNGDGSLKAPATPTQMFAGFLWACGYGQAHVVEFLLGKDIDLAKQDDDGQTPLHWAAMGGHVGVVTLLLARNPPLETKNRYGGSPFGNALYSAAHGGDTDTFILVIEALIAAGARLAERHPPVNARIDALLERHGSHSEPTFYWTGDEPPRPRPRKRRA